jgi:hypothetical protein
MNRTEKLGAIRSRINREMMGDAIAASEAYQRLEDEFKDAVNALGLSKKITTVCTAVGSFHYGNFYVSDNRDKESVDFESNPRVKRLIAKFVAKRDALLQKFPGLDNRDFLSKWEKKMFPVSEALSFVDPKCILELEVAFQKVKKYLERLSAKK